MKLLIFISVMIEWAGGLDYLRLEECLSIPLPLTVTISDKLAIPV